MAVLLAGKAGQKVGEKISGMFNDDKKDTESQARRERLRGAMASEDEAIKRQAIDKVVVPSGDPYEQRPKPKNLTERISINPEDDSFTVSPLATSQTVLDIFGELDPNNYKDVFEWMTVKDNAYAVAQDPNIFIKGVDGLRSSLAGAVRPTAATIYGPAHHTVLGAIANIADPSRLKEFEDIEPPRISSNIAISKGALALQDLGVTTREALDAFADFVDVPDNRRNYYTEIMSGLGQVGAIMGTGGYGLIGFGNMGFETQYAHALEMGKDPNTAYRMGVIGAASEILPEMMQYKFLKTGVPGLKKIVDGLPVSLRNKWYSKLVGLGIEGGAAALSEMTEETLTDLIIDIAEYAEYGDTEFLDGMWEQAAVAGPVGAIARLAMIGLGAKHTRIPDIRKARDYAQNDLANIAPQAKRDLIAKTTQGNFFVNSDGVEELMQSMNEQEKAALEAAIPGITEKMAESVETGNDLVIDRADYLAHMSSLKDISILDMYTKFSEEELTHFERAVGVSFTSIEHDEQTAAEAAEIKKYFVDQFKAAGYDANSARQMAHILSMKYQIDQSEAASGNKNAVIVAKRAREGYLTIKREIERGQTPGADVLGQKDASSKLQSSRQSRGLKTPLPKTTPIKMEEKSTPSPLEEIVGPDGAQAVKISLSAASERIPVLKELHTKSQQGDQEAAHRLNRIARDTLNHLLSGVSTAQIEGQDVTGLFGGYTEPSFSGRVTFEEADRPGVMAALAKLGEYLGQDEVHVREPVDDPAGTIYTDGSYATPVYKIFIKRAYNKEEVQQLIDTSGLYGVTFGDNFVEAYYVGDPENEQALGEFRQSVELLNDAIGENGSGVDKGVDRLWPYGQTEGTIQYEQIVSQLPRTVIEGADPIAREIADYLAGEEVTPYEQAPKITQEQALLQVEIAKAYEELPDNDMGNPIVRRAYEELATVVKEQFESLPLREILVFADRDADGKIILDKDGEVPFKGEPYTTKDGEGPSDQMRRDIRDNNRMQFLATNSKSFGPEGSDFTGHPLLEETEFTDSQDPTYKLKVNDLLRVVHDYYAHNMSQTNFGPRGEEAAWLNHMATIKSPWARWALTSETRGQNSWVNFNEKVYGQNVRLADRPFARQKAALLPIEYALTGDDKVDLPVMSLIEELPVEDLNGSLAARTLYQSVKLLTGEIDPKQFGLQKPRIKTRHVGEGLQRFASKTFGVIDGKRVAIDQKGKYVDEKYFRKQRDRISSWMVEEVLYELQSDGRDSRGWYSGDYQKALDLVGDVFPEMKTDQDARDLFTLVVAITSDGNSPEPNISLATSIYAGYRKGGVSEGELRFHTKNAPRGAIATTLKKMSDLNKEMGTRPLIDYLMQESTIRELKEKSPTAAKDLGGKYQAHVKMPMAALEVGAKTGVFFANLMGAENYVTMDRWWSRTFHRYMGRVVPEPTKESIKEFKKLLGKEDISDTEAIELSVPYSQEYAKRKSGNKKGYGANGHATELGLIVGKGEPHNKGKENENWHKEAKRLTGDKYEELLLRHNIERKANTIYKKAYEELLDAPERATERTFMLETTYAAQEKLKDIGVDLTAADIQAALWYYEKELYAKMGARQTLQIGFRQAMDIILGDAVKTFKAFFSADTAVSEKNGMTYNQAVKEMNSRKETILDSDYNSEERIARRKEIVQELIDEQKAEVGGEFGADKVIEIIIGLPGSGKSVFAGPLQKSLKALVVDPDNAKPKIDGYDNGLGAAAVHEESQAIIKGDENMTGLLEQAKEAGVNIIYPMIGKPEKLSKIVDKFSKAGYTINVRHVKVPLHVSLERAIYRFIKEGRPIPLEYITEVNGLPEETFELAKSLKEVSKYAEIDNSAKFEKGRKTPVTDTNDAAYPLEPGLASRSGELEQRPERLVAGARPQGTDQATGDLRQVLDDTVEPDILYQPAWHGSPYDFTQFMLEHLGKGEGAQAFGWGLYFAGKREIADWYREKLSNLQFIKRVDVIHTPDGPMGVNEAIDRWAPNKEEAKVWKTALKKLNDDYFQTQNDFINDDIIPELRLWAGLDQKDWGKFSIGGEGQLYEVNIPEDTDLVDWETKLKDQPPEVLEKVMNLPDIPVLKEWKKNGSLENVTGKELYQLLMEKATFIPFHYTPPGYRWESGPEAGKTYIVHKLVKEDTGEVVAEGSMKDEVLKSAGWGVDRIASEILNHVGIKGHKYFDASSRTRRGGTYNYVIYDDASIEIVEKFYQGQDQHRGQIAFFPDGRSVISVFEQADASTVLHELGHQFLRDMMFMAQDENASDRIKEDFKTIMKWVGSPDGVFTIEQEEQFARGFEAYLREGNAPSLELRSAFKSFKRWLLKVYQHVSSLNVNLTDDVRGVFDRMLATEEEIEQIKTMDVYKTNPGVLEILTKVQRKKYEKIVSDNEERAKEKLLKKALRQVKKKRTLEYKETRARVEEEVKEKFAKDKIHRLSYWLSTGKVLGDDAAKVMQMKLDVDDVIDIGGEGVLKFMPRNSTQKNGADASVVADLWGYKSADQMLSELVSTPDYYKAVQTEVEKQMLEKYPDMLDDGSIRIEAISEMSEELQLKKVEFEEKVLAEYAKIKHVNPLSIKLYAEGLLDKTRAKGISPYRYYRAALKNAKLSTKALEKKDYLKAAKYKRQQLINHYMFTEAVKAQKKYGKKVSEFKKLSRLSKKKAKAYDPDYVMAIKGILSKYGFGREDFDIMEWLMEMRKVDPIAAERVEDIVVMNTMNAKPYEDLTWAEFQDLSDTIDMLKAEGRTKNKIKVGGEALEKDQVFQQAEEILEKNLKPREKKPRDRVLATSAWARGTEFAHDVFAGAIEVSTKTQTMVEKMDGGNKTGFFYKLIRQQIRHGEIQNAIRQERAAIEMREITERHYGKKTVTLDDGREIEVAGGNLNSKKHSVYVPELDTTLTKSEILSMALNWGNEGNRQKLIDGGMFVTEAEATPWSEELLLKLMRENLDENDWGFVKDVWKYIDSYWGEIAALERRRSGYIPEKVDPAPFSIQTKDGKMIELDGGYYPIKYNALDQKGKEFDINQTYEQLAAGRFTKAQTARGHTIARVEGVKRSMRLDLGVMSQHIQEVITDLTMSEAIENTNKVISDKRFKAMLQKYLGPKAPMMLDIWLKDTAVGRLKSAGDWNRGMAGFRHRASLGTMAFKVSTITIQFTGITQSIVENGSLTIARGFMNYMKIGGPFAAKKIYEKSDFMKTRRATLNRDIADSIQRLQGKGLLDDIQATYFLPIIKTQEVVDMITWLGAYDDALNHRGMTEKQAVEFADVSVENSQGSGFMSSLSAIERGSTDAQHRLSEMTKMWTLFYSYFNTKLNLAMRKTAQTNFKDPMSVASLMGDYLIMFWIEALLGEAILGRLPDFDDEDDPVLAMFIYNFSLALYNAAGTLPVLRDVAGAWQGFGTGPAPAKGASDIGRATAQVGKSVAKYVEAGELPSGYDAAKTFLTLAHFVGPVQIPVGQLNQIIRGIEKNADGEGTFMDYLIYRE